MALSISQPGMLPERCVLFLTNAFSGGPIEAVPVGLRACFRVLPPSSTIGSSATGSGATAGASGATFWGNPPAPPAPAPPASEPPLKDLFLGVLATDHVGYVSWDLSPLIRRFRLELDIAQTSMGNGASLQIDSLTIRLAGPLTTEIDALNPAQLGSDAFVRLYATDPATLFQLDKGTFPSVQSPSLVDWYLSPASFSYMPAALVGADGCEALLPSNIATQRFKAYQIFTPQATYLSPSNESVKMPGGDPAATFQRPAIASLFTGAIRTSGLTAPPGGISWVPVTPSEIKVLLTYSISWLPVGHGLGQILYSMALAPCEQVNLAVIDWSRTDAASRSEETGLTDSLTHDTLRDRNVGEVVDASLREYQRGSASMAGALVGGGEGGKTGAVGGALSLGTTYSTSSGERNIAASTTQTLTDQFHQASAAVRDLRSTVVVQSTQQVSQNLQTRTIRNHNHSHALTLLYYEVLRHYRVVVELSDVGPALLVSQDMPSFDETAIFTYRRFLEASLLIEELRPGFDAIEKLFALSSPDWEPPPPPPPPSPDPRKFQFVLFDFQFHVGGNSNRLEVSGSIRKTNNDKMSEVKLIGVVDPNPDFLANPNNFKKVDFTVLGQGAPDGEVTWENAGFVFLHLKNNEDGDDACINILEIKATDANGVSYSLHSKENFEICVPSQDTISRLIPLAAPPPLPDPPKPLEPLQRLTPDERSARARLIAHLNANKPYYYRQIWMGEDPNHRLIRMAGTKVDIEGNVVGLFETVENRVVDVVGNQLVFPLAPGLLSSPDRSGAASELVDRFTPAISETLISLPTRGVFGEAKLGHCNASEIIDNTRFWDWQTSPCPEEAPAITGVSPQGLGAPTILTPTALPASILSIQAPQAEPDPIGLKSALDALKTPGIFNNMSGIDALKGLLTSLSDAAAKVLAPSKPEEPSPKPNPSPTPSPNPSPGQTPPKGSTTGSTSGSPSGSTSGSTSGSPSGSTSGSTTQPQPPTPQPQPSSQQPAPTPVYKGKALRKVLVSVTKGGSQELYCSGSVVVERQDVVGDKIEGQFNGGNGNVSLNLPSEWKSLIVRLYDLNILPEPFTEPPVASVGPLITGLITGNENQLTTVQFNYPAAKEIDFSVPPEIYVNGKKP